MSYNMRSGVHCSVSDTITITIFRRPPSWIRRFLISLMIGTFFNCFKDNQNQRNGANTIPSA